MATDNSSSSNENSTGVSLLTALFEPEDLILLRPVESWTTKRGTKSRVIHKAVSYIRPGMLDAGDQWVRVPGVLGATLSRLNEISSETLANLYFGVCPRFGGDGQYDQAWQIRTVRALWADLDDITIEDAEDKVDAAGLPYPSATVWSGSGVHVYWLLNTRHSIDDVGDPPPVVTEFIETTTGTKPHRCVQTSEGARYEIAQASRLLDACQMGAKAQAILDALSGISSALGSNHVFDLSRLLRVPGTFNRKNERNGDPPIMCRLVDLDPELRYDLTEFDEFAQKSPNRQRREKISRAPLPATRKLTTRGKDKLSRLAFESDIAKVGERSEKDFKLCCSAIESGYAQAETWEAVQNCGKFGERGQEYFDRTWSKAEFHIRQKIFEKATRPDPNDSTGPHCSPRASQAASHAAPGTAMAPDGEQESRPRIVFDAAVQNVADLVDRITSTLLEYEDVFSRAGQPAVLQNDNLVVIDGPGHLAGLLLNRAEFISVDGESVRHEPLPFRYGGVWLRSPAILRRLPVVSMFTRNPVFSEDDQLIAPGYDAETGIYYLGPAVEPLEGTTHLDALLTDFCFRELADRANFLGILLTLLLMPRFVGSKPGVILNGNQPGLGKTLLGQIIAILRDGAPVETATYNKNDEELEKRIGAMIRGGTTTIIVDNVKSKINSQCLERCLTDSILSFRLLGKSMSIRVENSHIFVITANSAGAGRDIVTRALPINLEYEGDPVKRTFSIRDPEGFAVDHRTLLLGELIGMIERWRDAGRPQAPSRSRFDKRGWSTTVGGILQVAGIPHFLDNLDQAAREFDSVGADFADLIEIISNDPRGWWTAAELVAVAEVNHLLHSELGDGSTRSKTTKMGILASRFIDATFMLTDLDAILRKRVVGSRTSYQIELVDRG